MINDQRSTKHVEVREAADRTGGTPAHMLCVHQELARCQRVESAGTSEGELSAETRERGGRQQGVVCVSNGNVSRETGDTDSRVCGHFGSPPSRTRSATWKPDPEYD